MPVLLNTQTPPDVLNYFLQDTGARIALCESTFLDVFSDDVLKGTSLKTIVVANGAAKGEKQRAASDFLPVTRQRWPAHQPGRTTCLLDVLFRFDRPAEGHRPSSSRHGLYAGVLRPPCAEAQGRRYLLLGAEDLLCLWLRQCLHLPFSIGATTVLMPGQPRADAVLETIETFRPTVLFGLPTLYTSLARAESVKRRDLSSLRQSMSAAEVLSQDIYEAWKALTGHGPTEGLGSTELLHIYLSNSLTDHRIGSAGARVPGYEIRLETPDGKVPDAGEEGVMFVRGHSSAPTYWNRPDKTRETMRGDWIYTGDRFIEKDGYYYFQGRADELIKVSGQWVWPLEVERCLNEHPDVHECAVLGHQMEDRRMTLRAVIRLREGKEASPAQSDALRAYVKSRLQPYKYPRIVEFVTELPKTGTGKIDRQAVAAAPVRDLEQIVA